MAVKIGIRKKGRMGRRKSSSGSISHGNIHNKDNSSTDSVIGRHDENDTDELSSHQSDRSSSNRQFCGACPYCSDSCGGRPCCNCCTDCILHTDEIRCISDCTQYYTWCEIRRHNTEESAWLVVGNDVFDVTDYVHSHPGGKQSILRKAGGVLDCTRDFFFHSKKGQRLWRKCYIGKVRDCPSSQDGIFLSGNAVGNFFSKIIHSA
mmetsp:Transcript_8648/g.15775  ORF Transcript_8648/g.15775 Transcript_8648/m.15775 type:complete len:206 (+) Transcript_8648:31-648(+)